MAILIRESRIIDGKEFKDLRVFRSESFLVTSEDEVNAEILDKYIADVFSRILDETKKNHLIDLKNKTGVIKLWYYVGQRLKFVDDPTIVNPTDKKYIWTALWQHAGNLVPGEMKSRAGTTRDHFLYCYRLASFEEEFVYLAGNWRAWQEFFDSPILSNRKILAWFERKIPEIKKQKLKYWLRDFIKIIRNEFQNVDFAFLSECEINTKLDHMYVNFINNRQ